MQLAEAKKQFISEFGAFGSKWGVNRTMAQVHALLLVSAESLCADDVMEQLGISRGNANMNLRALIDWGLVRKTHKEGQRKEYFYAEKDIWKITRRIIKERKKRELEPLRLMLNELQTNIDDDSPEAVEFIKIMNELSTFGNAADTALEKIIESDQKWLFNSLLKFLGASSKKTVL